MSDLEQQFIEMVDKMPAFPGSVNKILELTADINCAPKDLVQVIDHDPVMMARILKLVNSAYFGLSREITSINHGVVFVGINTIKNLAISIATMGMLPTSGPAGLDMDAFLLHSLGTATLARELSKRLGGSADESTNFFVAGLLHDIGKIVFAQFKAEQMQRALSRVADEGVALHVAEMDEIGADHSHMGGMLAEKWQLPPALVSCIREHHSQSSEEESSKILDCVVAANLMSKRLEFGQAGNITEEEFPEPVVKRFGMGVAELIDTTESIEEELEKARVFIR